MSTEKLREELHRIGESAPVAEVRVGTWSRARRARTRDRLLAGAAVVAVLALVGGLAGVLPARDSTPVAGGSQPAVPSHIWSVPDRLTMQTSDGSWSSDRVETDLAIGRGAAAYVTSSGLPVVIGAEDGAYHLLDLPGFLGNSVLTRGGEAGMTLSPDGRQLAYGWAGPVPASDATPMPSGVRVLDLATGDVRTVPLSTGRGVKVDSLAWSPDSTWLVWRGRVATYWTGTSSAYRSSATGRIAPRAAASENVPDGNAEGVAAVGDDGAVSLLTAERVTAWDGHRLGSVRLRGDQPVSAAAASPSGGLAAVGGSPNPEGIASVDLATGRAVVHRYLAGLYPGGADNRPLGWIGDDLLVALVTPRDAAGASALDRQIVVTTPERNRTSTYRIVGQVDPGVPDSLSVAVDLMTLARPTVDRPKPDWPWSTDRIAWTIGLGLAGAMALILAARALWRRTRSM